jgi:predicted DNA-binding transcriptional regulator YafY
VLEPLGLVLKAGIWYVVANAGDGKGPRTYKVNQIFELTALPDRFERPSTFDLAAYWEAYLREYQDRLYQGQATVRFSPRGIERLPDLCGRDVREAVERTGRKDKQGWVRATVPIESMTHAEGQFLRFGADAEVLRPTELRTRLVTIVRDLAELYGPAPRSRPNRG